MNIPLEDYFKYHPPTTEERRQKHEIINNAALRFAKDPTLYGWFADVIRQNVGDGTTQRMAIASLALAMLISKHPLDTGIETEEVIKAWWEAIKDIPRPELFLYFVQQSRMFSNQGITMDDLNQTNSPNTQ